MATARASTPVFTNATENISSLPISTNSPVENSQITIGDLHANALKLVWFLIKEGVYTLGDEDYQALQILYDKYRPPGPYSGAPDLAAEDLTRFNQLIAKLQKRDSLPSGILIRLIGDELADRGANDYFILKIFEKLHHDGIGLECVFSNHGTEFIEALETSNTADDFIAFLSPLDLSNQIHSLKALQRLVANSDDREGQFQKVQKLYEDHYRPHFRALSYTLSEDKQSITLYTHAPVGLDVIKACVDRLNTFADTYVFPPIVYDDSTAEKLASTIDAMNSVFLDYFVKQGKMRELYRNDNKDEDITATTDPFALLMWRRDRHLRSTPEQPQEQHSYHLYFVHGHDGESNRHDNVFNLNNRLGQFANIEGDYATTCVPGTTRALTAVAAAAAAAATPVDEDEHAAHVDEAEAEDEHAAADEHEHAAADEHEHAAVDEDEHEAEHAAPPELASESKDKQLKIHRSERDQQHVLRKLLALHKKYTKSQSEHPDEDAPSGELIKLVEYYREHKATIDVIIKDNSNSHCDTLRAIAAIADKNKNIFVTYVNTDNIHLRCLRGAKNIEDAVRNMNKQVLQKEMGTSPPTPTSPSFVVLNNDIRGRYLGFTMEVGAATVTAGSPSPPKKVGWVVRKGENGEVVSRGIKPPNLTLSKDDYKKWAVTMLENYKSANGRYPSVIRGSWDKQFVKAALLYCALKGHEIRNETKQCQNLNDMEQRKRLATTAFPARDLSEDWRFFYGRRGTIRQDLPLPPSRPTR
ncbi:MAG: hypothetical protein A3E83_08880 [Gammaproteobacteria bacterium RIFCSPHIGHO2_12_FULL_41_20]|nr:MAG: hypothetical protein A3E83_08880 [Gammaproteobacteria bacterium RIFCSPHIGHO2_12_FULL_41_20]